LLHHNADAKEYQSSVSGYIVVTFVLLVYISSQRHIQKRVIDKMSTSDTKLNDLCEGLDDCKLDAEKEISDKELSKHPPSIFGDCPICFLQLPSFNKGWKYMTCCGKVICSGCIHAPVYDSQGNMKLIIESVHFVELQRHLQMKR